MRALKNDTPLARWPQRGWGRCEHAIGGRSQVASNAAAQTQKASRSTLVNSWEAKPWCKRSPRPPAADATLRTMSAEQEQSINSPSCITQLKQMEQLANMQQRVPQFSSLSAQMHHSVGWQNRACLARGQLVGDSKVRSPSSKSGGNKRRG